MHKNKIPSLYTNGLNNRKHYVHQLHSEVVQKQNVLPRYKYQKIISPSYFLHSGLIWVTIIASFLI